VINARLYAIAAVVLIGLLVVSWFAGNAHGKAKERERQAYAVVQWQKVAAERGNKIKRIQADANERARQAELVAAGNEAKIDELEARVRDRNNCPEYDADVVQLYECAAAYSGLPDNGRADKLTGKADAAAAVRVCADMYGATSRQLNQLIDTIQPYLSK
jgi:hypothetical protein